MDKTKLFKLTNTIFSFLIGIAAVYYLYHSFKGKTEELDLLVIGKTLSANAMVLFFVVVLMMVNWAGEIIKWNRLLQRVQKLSIRELVESLTLGILLSMITPNRLGEFGGRQLHIKKENRLLSFYYQSFAALSQLLITILLGTLSAGYIISQNSNLWLYNAASIFIAIVLLLLYFYSNLWMKGLTFIKKKWRSLDDQRLMIIGKSDRTIIFLLGMLRYIVFCFQFGLLFIMFSEIYDNKIMIGLSITFLISAVIPTSWISELAVRSSVIFYVFEELELDGSVAVISSILLWLINLLLPAFLGFFSLNKVNWSGFMFKK